jgi:hypothetical protein
MFDFKAFLRAVPSVTPTLVSEALAAAAEIQKRNDPRAKAEPSRKFVSVSCFVAAVNSSNLALSRSESVTLAKLMLSQGSSGANNGDGSTAYVELGNLELIKKGGTPL